MNNIAKIKTLINQAKELIGNRVIFSDTEFTKWHLRTKDFLAGKFGKASEEYNRFDERYFYPSIWIGPSSDNEINEKCIQCCAEGLTKTIAELEFYLELEGEDNTEQALPKGEISMHSNKIFVVHGHDAALKSEVARFLQKLGLEAIILSEQANQGKTIIEKLEVEASEARAAIVLLTCDDLGRAKSDKEDKSRARQNVIFEAGYFMGKLGRDKVIIIREQDIDTPSDIHGMGYTDKQSWQLEVVRELKKIGYTIDINKLL